MHIRRIALPAAGAAGALALAVAPASAHVTISPSTTAAGSYAVLTVSVPHGCDGSATTRIAISMPEEIPQVTATRNPFWDLEVQTEPLAEPIEDAHGNEITQREAVVVYTAKEPLPDPDRDTMELSVQLPDAAGETLAFPIVQTCEQGETGWTEVAEDGADADALEHPAPTITITEAEGDGHGHGGDDDAADAREGEDHEGADASGMSDGPEAAEDENDDDGGNGLALAGLGAGVLGVAVGGIALARTRRA